MPVGGRRYPLIHAPFQISNRYYKIAIQGVNRGIIGAPRRVSCSDHISVGLQIRAYLMLSWPEVVHVIQHLAGFENQKHHDPSRACEEVIVLLFVALLVLIILVVAAMSGRPRSKPAGLKPITVIK